VEDETNVTNAWEHVAAPLGERFGTIEFDWFLAQRVGLLNFDTNDVGTLVELLPRDLGFLVQHDLIIPVQFERTFQKIDASRRQCCQVPRQRGADLMLITAIA